MTEGRRRLALALAAGAASVLAFAPFGLWFVAPLALAVLFVLWARAPSPRAAATIGFAFGLGAFGAGVSWVYVSLHDFGGMPAPLAAIAVLAFCGYLALYPALAGWAAARLSRGARLALLAGPAAWTLGEWLRGWVLGGFPWLAIGYSQVPDSPLAALAPVLGTFGLSLATALAGGGLAAAWLARGYAWLLAPGLAAALAAAGIAAGRFEWTAPEGEPLLASLVQGSVRQDMKWRPEARREAMERYLDLARRAQGRLVILPETAIPMFLDEIPGEYLEALAAGARARGGDLVFGVPEYRRDAGGARYYNSVVSLGTSPAQAYRKSHLTPFGEFIPLRPLLAWVYDTLLHMPLSDFAAGPPGQPALAVAGQRAAVSVCYESLFPAEMRHHLPSASLLVNVSNDAWFGASIGPEQHLQIARTRALELGRPMLRATNTGITAIIGARGEILARAPAFAPVVLEARIAGRAGTTPYARGGDAPVLAAAVALLALGAFGRPRASR